MDPFDELDSPGEGATGAVCGESRFARQRPVTYTAIPQTLNALHERLLRAHWGDLLRVSSVEHNAWLMSGTLELRYLCAAGLYMSAVSVALWDLLIYGSTHVFWDHEFQTVIGGYAPPEIVTHRVGPGTHPVFSATVPRLKLLKGIKFPTEAVPFYRYAPRLSFFRAPVPVIPGLLRIRYGGAPQPPKQHRPGGPAVCTRSAGAETHDAITELLEPAATHSTLSRLWLATATSMRENQSDHEYEADVLNRPLRPSEALRMSNLQLPET